MVLVGNYVSVTWGGAEYGVMWVKASNIFASIFYVDSVGAKSGLREIITDISGVPQKLPFANLVNIPYIQIKYICSMTYLPGL